MVRVHHVPFLVTVCSIRVIDVWICKHIGSTFLGMFCSMRVTFLFIKCHFNHLPNTHFPFQIPILFYHFQLLTLSLPLMSLPTSPLHHSSPTSSPIDSHSDSPPSSSIYSTLCFSHSSSTSYKYSPNDNSIQS